MTVAASFLSTKAENQSLFVALVQGASVTLVAVETEGTLRTLRLDNPALIYGTWICSLVNLVLSFLVPVLVLRGHINNRKWGTYSNATALFLASSMSVGSALLLYFETLKKVSNSIRTNSAPTTTKLHTNRAILYVWLLFLPLSAGGIALFVLAFISIFFEQIYGNMVLSFFCALSVLAMRFFPFKLLHKSYWADAKDSALASQEASNNSLSTVVKMMGDERHSESQSWETICSFDHKRREPC
ncbi:hypothetical protein PtrV1_05003 [Pyrenophora tritici-repentis]|nr:hypothetical protein PtrV1_05003 [Pyrenophora tritici-repentis]